MNRETLFKKWCVLLALSLLTGCAAHAQVPSAQSAAAAAQSTPSAPQADRQAAAAAQEASGAQRCAAIQLSAGGQHFSVVLEDSDCARALAKKLPLTLRMAELNGNEKYCRLDSALPADASAPGEIHAGDLMLYGDDCLVLFYKSFSSGYSYTRLGHLDAPPALAQALGAQEVSVTLSAA